MPEVKFKINSVFCGFVAKCVCVCVWSTYLPLTIRPTAKSVCIVRWNTFVLWAVFHFRRTHWCRCRLQTGTPHSDFVRPYFVRDIEIASIASIHQSPIVDILHRHISQPYRVWRVQHFRTKSYPHFEWHYVNAPYNVLCETIEDKVRPQLLHGFVELGRFGRINRRFVVDRVHRINLYLHDSQNRSHTFANIPSMV